MDVRDVPVNCCSICLACMRHSALCMLLATAAAGAAEAAALTVWRWPRKSFAQTLLLAVHLSAAHAVEGSFLVLQLRQGGAVPPSLDAPTPACRQRWP
jgi:hypothetical protein